MSNSKRPMSPYMLGPYYKLQITSLLSILNRLTGVFMALVMAPLLLWWLVALASGEQSFAALSGYLGSVPGRLVIAASVFSFSFHLFAGIRHLIWDAGWMMEIHQVKMSGWFTVVASIILSILVLGAGLCICRIHWRRYAAWAVPVVVHATGAHKGTRPCYF